MSTDNSQKKDWTLVITLITVLGTILVAFLTNYREELAPIFFKALTETPTMATVSSPTAPPSIISTDTPSEQENLLSPAIQIVDQYFKYINNAEVGDDLRRAWGLLTTKLQCNPSDNCDFAHYRDYWWQLKLQYKLFNCGSNTVATELIYYDRNIGFPSPSAIPNYVSYELVDENGQLKLNTATIETGISAYCKLALSVP